MHSQRIKRTFFFRSVCLPVYWSVCMYVYIWTLLLSLTSGLTNVSVNSVHSLIYSFFWTTLMTSTGACYFINISGCPSTYVFMNFREKKIWKQELKNNILSVSQIYWDCTLAVSLKICSLLAGLMAFLSFLFSRGYEVVHTADRCMESDIVCRYINRQDGNLRQFLNIYQWYFLS